MRKRVFVSGGAGVIGTALVDRLLEEGADVFVGDLKPCPQKWRGRLRYRMGDLNEISKRELNAFSPEIFFHLAATFERTEETPGFFKQNYRHNVSLSHHLLDCLQGCSSLNRVVFASSYLVYDPALYLFDTPQDSAVNLREDFPIRPRNLCGAAKFYHEAELSFYENMEVPFVAARIFRVYGRHSRDVISRWIQQALRGETLEVYSPENRFDYIFADDVAEGLLQLSETDVSGVVNLGSGYARTVSEVLEILSSHFPNLKKYIETIADPVYEASQADMKRFVEITEWCPPHTLEDAIPKLIEYEREQLQTTSLQIPERQGVLISSLSKKAPLVEAVRSGAKKIGCLEVIHGGDVDPYCVARCAVDFFWEMPPVEQLTREILRDYCRHHSIAAIIPTRDGELEFYARHREWFAENGIGVMISDIEAIRICIDKLHFAEWLSEGDFPAIPTSTSIKAIPESPRYVVKECYGAGSRSIGLNLTQEDAEKHAKNLDHPIFQPYIAGLEYSVDVYRDISGNVKGCVARRRDRIVNGESQITTTERKIALESLCKRIANEMDLYGHAVFQVIESTDHSFHIVECNPRFGGASTASIAAGLDTFYWFFLECCKENLDRYPFERCRGEVRQIRYAADKIFLI